jgi:hypothetical protein
MDAEKQIQQICIKISTVKCAFQSMLADILSVMVTTNFHDKYDDYSYFLGKKTLAWGHK